MTGFDARVIWWAVIAGVAYLVLSRTQVGNWIYATGDNRESARANGVPVDRVRISLFMFTAFCATIFAACQVFETNTADAAKGNLKELEAIAIAVVGGTLMTGGFGSVVGVVFGAVDLRAGGERRVLHPGDRRQLLPRLRGHRAADGRVPQRERAQAHHRRALTMATKPLIRVEKLVKRFGPFTALNGIDLEIYRGEVHALLGDNGAGKSTLIKILSGVHPPTEGRIYVEASPSLPLAARREHGGDRHRLPGSGRQSAR